MAHKRQRGDKWEFTVKRAGLLDRPLTLTFDTERDGDEYCRKLEALLDRGIVPTQHQVQPRVQTIETVVRQYERDVAVPSKDQEILRTVVKSCGNVPFGTVDANWVDEWVRSMKQDEGLAPATIRAKVGALARAADWAMRKKLIVLPDHPLRTLREGYASYTDTDSALAGGRRQDVERDRRLEGDEEQRIRAVITRGVLSRRQRPRQIEHQESVLAMFDLALETAMRMREMYTLEVDQVLLGNRVVFLDKTKNGDSRSVPLTTIAVKVLGEQCVGKMGVIFPWIGEQRRDLKLTTNYVSKLFSDIFAEAGCPDLRFHDLRHESVSRMFERTTLPAEKIMKISGHRTHRMMMRYVKLRPSDLADQLW